MRIRRKRPHQDRPPYKDLTDQTEADALARFKEFLQEYWCALSEGRRQDVVNRFVLMDLTAHHCQETFGRAPALPVLPADYRQELADSRQAHYLAAAVAEDQEAAWRSQENLNAFLKDLQQQGRAAGIGGRASPEEKASYEKLFTQYYGPPNDPILDIDTIDLGAVFQHAPLWAIYRTIGYALEGLTPEEMRASALHFAVPAPTEAAESCVVAVHLKMMTDLLRLTEGWTRRRDAAPR